jgi:HK97 family phage major capsid protein
MILKLKAKIAQKRAAASKILNLVAASPETRDMSPDEKTQFDTLIADVETIKTQIAQYEAMEADEAEAAAPEVEADAEAAARRSATPGRRSHPVGEAPAVHAEKRTYSILRAIRSAVSGQPLDGLEGEVSKEVERRTGRAAKGFFLPLGSDPEIRSLMNGGRRAEVRTDTVDLSLTTGAGAIFTHAELPLIDLLRNKLVVKELGAKVMAGMKGAFAIPRQTGASTVFWLAEGSGATVSNQTIDQVPFSPKVCLALTNISRKFMLQTSVDAEEFVKNDLAETLAREWDRVALNGSGTNQPLGILQNTGIATLSAGVQGGTNGALLSYAQVVGMESGVSTNNAEMGSLSYLTNPGQRGKLKQTPVVGTTFPTFIWTKGDRTGGPGEVNGYEARASTVIPANLTKGSASGVCSAIIYGNWNDLIVASFDDAVDFLVNPYTLQAQGAVTISLEMAIDANVRHNESFQVITDAL